MQVGDRVLGRKHGLHGTLTLNDEGYTVVGKYRDGTGFRTLEKPLDEVALNWRSLTEGENGNKGVEGYAINITFESTELSDEARHGIIDEITTLFAKYEELYIEVAPIINEEETE